MDNRINPNKVLEGIISIFNKNRLRTDNYTGSITVEFGEECVNIFNNGVFCLLLDIPKYIDDKYIIYIGLIKSCSPSKSGTKIISNILEFGVMYDYDLCTLLNLSELDFNFNNKKISINLTMLKILEIGNSWYSQFGFENQYTLQFQQKISKKINESFSELKIIIEKNYKDVFLKDFNLLFSYFEEFIHNNTKINEFTKIILKYIYSNCSNNICSESIIELLYNFKKFIILLNAIIFSLISNHLYTVDLINDLITFFYKDLSIDFNEKQSTLHLVIDSSHTGISGGIKSKKIKSKKIKSKKIKPKKIKPKKNKSKK